MSAPNKTDIDSTDKTKQDGERPNSHLAPWERWTAGGIGACLIILSGVIFYIPPRRPATDRSTYSEKEHIENAQPTTYATAFFTAGALLVIFALNGRRLRRISKDGVETEPDGREGNLSPVKRDPDGGKDGSGTLAEKSSNTTEGAPGDEKVTKPEQIESLKGPTSPDELSIPAFGALTQEEQKIIATLWFAQWKYPDTGPYNWGFTINPHSKEYPTFWRGRNTLYQRRLIDVDLNGLVGLTARGVKLCKGYEKSILAHADKWTNFAPLANS